MKSSLPLAGKSVLDQELNKAVQAIDEEYDLESHLEEKSFVFEKINKALDKSTRIANSHKVFSRSSAKEIMGVEFFAVLLQDTIEHLPAKVRGDVIILSFKDQGHGIPKEKLKEIFNPFYTTKPPGKGTGLGLTIASEIVKKYGGLIKVQSVLKEGTTISFHFKKAAPRSQ